MEYTRLPHDQPLGSSAPSNPMVPPPSYPPPPLNDTTLPDNQCSYAFRSPGPFGQERNVICPRGLSKEETLDILSPIFPAILSRTPLDRIIFEISVGGQWATVLDSSWEDVMVKGKPGRVRVSVVLTGRDYWRNSLKWAAIIGSPLWVFLFFIMHIPLRLILVKDGKVEIKKDPVLFERETTVDLERVTLYKHNAGTTGFYRVAYSSAHLDALEKESSKQNSVLSPEDRVGLVADAYKLSQTGHSPTSRMLNLISHFKYKEAKVVWTSVAEALGDLSSVWWEQSKTIQDSLKDLTQTILAPLIDRLGFEFHESEEPDVKELRTLAFGQAGAAGYQPVIDFATESFQKFAKGDENVIAPDFQRSIFRLVS